MGNVHCGGSACLTNPENCGCSCETCKPVVMRAPDMPVEGHAPGCGGKRVRSILISERELHIGLCLDCYRVVHSCSAAADHKPPKIYRCSHPRCHWAVEVLCDEPRKYSHTEGPPYCPCGAAMELAK